MLFTCGWIPYSTQRRTLLAFIGFLFFVYSTSGQSIPAEQNHEQRASVYLQEKNTQLAIEEYRAALAANLGVLLFFQKDYSGAEPLLRKAIERRPDLTKIRSLLGLSEMYLGETNEARTNLEAAMPQLQDPSIRVQTGLALIEIDAASEDLDKAAAVVALLRDDAPTDPRVLYTAYRIATQQAAEALLSLSLVAPDSAQMHEAMAQELERALDTSGAITNLRKAVELDPTLPGVHYELAEALHEANDERLRAEAEEEYKLSLKQNPHDARSAAALGNLARDRGDTQDAIAYYAQAIAIDPQLSDAAIALADLDAATGDFAAAAITLKPVVEADPSNILAHYRLFTAYRMLGRKDDSKRELEAFEHYKSLKEKMQTIYEEMRQHIPGGEEQKMEK